jgi:protein Mpv17
MPVLRGQDTLGLSPPAVHTSHNSPYYGARTMLLGMKDYAIGIRDFVVDVVTEYRVLRIPVLNWAIIVMYAAWLLRLTLRFTQLYAMHALMTMMITNLLLYGLADTLAQTLRSMIAFKPEAQPERSSIFVKFILEKGRPRRVILDEEDDDLLELGLEDELWDPHHEHHLPRSRPEIFHFRRLALFSVWGLIISFFQSPWYAFLNSAYTEDNKFLSALKKVLTDQLCFSPVSLACFLSYMTVVLEGGDQNAVSHKLRTVYLPTLAVNYAVWPASQFFNFMVMPKPMQIPFSSTIGVFWNAYLSLKNAR